MKKITILSFLLLFMIFSCKKKITEVNNDYVGNWTAHDSEASYSIIIDSKSKASYFKYKGFSETEVSGFARIKGSNTLKILTKKFKIDQTPIQEIDTLTGALTYFMILDGLEYRRY